MSFIDYIILGYWSTLELYKNLVDFDIGMSLKRDPLDGFNDLVEFEFILVNFIEVVLLTDPN